MNFGVIVFPGSNCDHDCFYAVESVLKHPVKYIWHKETSLRGMDCIIIPGGFSYGDYLRCGAIAKFSPIMDSVVKFANKGGVVIGICNGFQILLEAGLLPGAMLRNLSMHFICKYINIVVENNSTAFTNECRAKQVLRIPIAHNEGNYYIDSEGLKMLEGYNGIVFRYCSPDGSPDKSFNPNGAVSNIAGIINKQGNVLGMMPHPERSCQSVLGSSDGLFIFKSILKV
jgi:phosphoribosylformylglycinamidine synthase subunit PurQ / glutaminase